MAEVVKEASTPLPPSHDSPSSSPAAAGTAATGTTGNAATDPSVGENERIRNEEYKIWKKQSPFLYDVCISKALAWPASSVQWLPAVEPYATKGASGTGAGPAFDTYSLSLAASDPTTSRSGVIRSKVDLPSKSFAQLPPSADQRAKVHKFSAELELDLPPEPPFKAVYNPSNPDIVATANKGGAVYVLDCNGKLQARALKYHTKDTFSVSWHPKSAQTLASASADGRVAVWDVENYAEPTAVLAHGSESGAVNCLQIAPLTDNQLASAGDERIIRFWDLREGKEIRSITDSHATPVTALHYNPHNEMILATGSADGAIAIWDVRMSSASLAGLAAGPGPGPANIQALKWSPHDESVIASAGADCQVKVWDLSLHGQDQTAAEEQEGPPELIFIHGGHLGNVLDLDWHPTVPWTLSSVSEDSIACVWKISGSIVDAEPDN